MYLTGLYTELQIATSGLISTLSHSHPHPPLPPSSNYATPKPVYSRAQQKAERNAVYLFLLYPAIRGRLGCLGEGGGAVSWGVGGPGRVHLRSRIRAIYIKSSRPSHCCIRSFVYIHLSLCKGATLGFSDRQSSFLTLPSDPD